MKRMALASLRQRGGPGAGSGFGTANLPRKFSELLSVIANLLYGIFPAKKAALSASRKASGCKSLSNKSYDERSTKPDFEQSAERLA
jgi:hypothetical protein